MTERVFIATPSGTGKPDIDFVASLNSTVLDLQESGKERPDVRFIHGNCYVHLCRNLLTHEFMKSDCSHLFFWDDDVAAPKGALRRLLAYDRDIMVAPYPKKVAPGLPPTKTWPYSLADGVPDALGLLECDMVATGFLLIKRKVIEALYEKHADRVFYHEPYKSDVIDLFPTGLIPDFPKNAMGKPMWWGEDYAFSVLAQRAGFKMWLDPIIQLLHAGRNVWAGNFAKSAADPGWEPASKMDSAA
jgi:hypothetical protein